MNYDKCIKHFLLKNNQCKRQHIRRIYMIINTNKILIFVRSRDILKNLGKPGYR